MKILLEHVYEPCALSSRLRMSSTSCRRRSRSPHNASASQSKSTAPIKARSFVGENRAQPSRGRSDGKRAGPAMARARLFFAGGGHLAEQAPRVRTAFAPRSKIAAPRHPPLSLRPSALLRVLIRPVRRLSDRHEGGDRRGQSTEERRAPIHGRFPKAGRLPRR